MIVITVAPCKPEPHPKKWASMFEARIGHVVLCRSRQPFVDAARELLKLGLPPENELAMRHEGVSTNALLTTIGLASKWTVDESGPFLRAWKPMPSREGYGFIAVNAEEGT